MFVNDLRIIGRHQANLVVKVISTHLEKEKEKPLVYMKLQDDVEFGYCCERLGYVW